MLFAVGSLLLVTQNLASLTTLASCGVQKKLVCGPHERIIYLFCRLFDRQSYAQWNLDFPKVCFHSRESPSALLISLLKGGHSAAMIINYPTWETLYIAENHNIVDKNTRVSPEAVLKICFFFQCFSI